MVNALVWVIGMVTVSGGEVVGPLVAVAVLTRLPPASISACVTVCEPVHVVVAPGASDVTGQTTAPSTRLSDTAIGLSVTLPVFLTRNVYGTTWPAAVIVVVVEFLSIV